jgi:hypothetical protein
MLMAVAKKAVAAFINALGSSLSELSSNLCTTGKFHP